MLYQISVGGCLLEWDEAIEKDDEFRLEVQLPNQNWLPLNCVAKYVMEDDSVGVQFLDISQFEQELIAELMSGSLAEEGIPMKVDPFSTPKTFVDRESNELEKGAVSK